MRGVCAFTTRTYKMKTAWVICLKIEQKVIPKKIVKSGLIIIIINGFTATGYNYTECTYVQEIN